MGLEGVLAGAELDGELLEAVKGKPIQAWSAQQLDDVLSRLAQTPTGQPRAKQPGAMLLLRLHQSVRKLMQRVLEPKIKDWGVLEVSSTWNGVKAILEKGVVKADDHRLMLVCVSG